jgi:DNA-binding transcriptional MocR family regulator
MGTLERIVGLVDTASAKGIAEAVSRLIAAGLIAPRERMPTTRVLAERLGTSAGLISDAWKILVADGILETRGRRGTFVIDPESHTPWRQFRGLVGSSISLDLSTGFPDPELLIDLRPYLRKLSEGAPYRGYPIHELDPALGEVLKPVMPISPVEDNTLLSTHVLGALSEIFPAIGPPSTQVIVAQTEFAPYLDLLEHARLKPVPVPLGLEGPDLASVQQAVLAGAKAIILQPRVHNPTGISMSRARLRAIAELCAMRDVWIFEGDFYGDLLPVPPMSAAEWAPAHTVYMKAFSKDIHPDIRVAALVGAPRLIKEARRRRVGGFEVSRINQDLLRLLLSDPARKQHLLKVREEYARRQRVFIETLAAHAIHIPSGGGFNVWVPVHSESNALAYLASKGIGVAPGSAFQVNQPGSPHIRVSTAAISGDVEQVATEIAIAASVNRVKN